MDQNNLDPTIAACNSALSLRLKLIWQTDVPKTNVVEFKSLVFIEVTD